MQVPVLSAGFAGSLSVGHIYVRPQRSKISSPRPEHGMPPSLARIEAEALQLSAEEKVRLADHLLASVSGDSDIDAAWGEEAMRRLAEVEAGVVLAPLEDAVARARRAIL
jgi:hypothetical protein